MWIVCLLASITVVCGQCPAQWVVHDESCYHFSHDTETWIDAMTFCTGLEAYLVEINDARENDFLANTMKADSWIGANDLMAEGLWRWKSSHEEVFTGYSRWGPGEPNARTEDENCAMVYGSHSSVKGFWNDATCHTFYHYICEKDAETVPVFVG